MSTNADKADGFTISSEVSAGSVAGSGPDQVSVTVGVKGNFPVRATEGSAGGDLIFDEISDEGPVEYATLHPGGSILLKTGTYLELPEGFEAQVRPRSGLAYKHGLTVLNSPGTIDSDYRGEIGVIMINHGPKEWTFNRGDRIAQLVIQPVPKVTFVGQDTLSDTMRGEGGFGSTGT